MGVLKAIEYKGTGIFMNYWRINAVEVDIETNLTKCRVGGYVAKTDALMGKKAVTSYNYVYSGANNPINMMTDPREYQNLLYGKIIEAGSPMFPNKLAGGSIVSDLPE